jgi:hypothetical protein
LYGKERLVPRRLTVSLSSKPLDAKDARVSDRSALGEGSSDVATSRKEWIASLLPVYSG